MCASLSTSEILIVIEATIISFYIYIQNSKEDKITFLDCECAQLTPPFLSVYSFLNRHHLFICLNKNAKKLHFLGNFRFETCFCLFWIWTNISWNRSNYNIFFWNSNALYPNEIWYAKRCCDTAHERKEENVFFAHFSSFVNTWQTVPVVFVLHSYAFVYILTKFSGNSLSEHTRIFLLIMCGIDSIIHLSYTYWIRI